MNKPTANPAEVAKALAELNRRIISSNEEFPDVQWAVACAHNVKYEALADAYDAEQAAK